jgi:hypothetical protein
MMEGDGVDSADVMAGHDHSTGLDVNVGGGYGWWNGSETEVDHDIMKD